MSELKVLSQILAGDDDKVAKAIIIKEKKNGLEHDKTNKMTCEFSKVSDQSGHPPSLIRIFAVRLKKIWVLGYQ